MQAKGIDQSGVTCSKETYQHSRLVVKVQQAEHSCSITVQQGSMRLINAGALTTEKL